MSTPKRYYWIKLRESFMSSDTVDFLMSQKGGADYVVLYQLLCLKTINTGGRLSRTIGEIVIPYDVDKIQRDCKWFSTDTIRVALNLYKRFGLIYEECDGTLVLAEHDNLVGSETSWAAQKRSQRSIASPPQGGQCPPRCPPDVHENVHPDIRDKDIRDKSLDTRAIDIERAKDNEKDDAAANSINPYGDVNRQQRPDFNTLEVYVSSNLRCMSQTNLEELISFRDSLPDDVIRYAIDEACANGSPNYGYVRGILNRCIDSGFKTLGDVKAHEAQRRQRLQDKKNGTTDYSNEDESDPFKGW